MRGIKILLFALALPVAPLAQDNPFVQVKGKQFVRNGRPYYFLGANAWYFMNIGSAGEGGDRQRLIQELDALKNLGVNNLRIMASAEGPETEPLRVKPALQPEPGVFNEELLKGLDFALAEMGKRDMTAVLCLNNYFMWSGGMAQYVSWAEGSPIPYPSTANWNEFMKYSARFFANEKAKSMFRDFIKQIVTRTNSVTGQKYVDDPAIMAWQLGNEPRGGEHVAEYIQWVDETAGLIQSLDKNHLVSLGGEGLLPDDGAVTAFRTVSRSKRLDYLTMHLWIENWGWYNPREPETYAAAMDNAEDYIEEHQQIASDIGKPIVLEEFGISRDNGEYSSDGADIYRQRYFEYIFDRIYKDAGNGGPMAGSNFWSWSGIYQIEQPGALWAEGDPFSGDPPHEIQGWYSIHTEDDEMMELIAAYAAKMNALNKKNLSQAAATEEKRE